MNQEIPFNDWLRHVRTAEDYFKLSVTLQGIPSNWLHWVEKQVCSAEKRGIIIESPLAYRMAVLWNGIVLLQESKFICDTIENALRKNFMDYIVDKNVTYSDLTIPNWKRIQRSINQPYNRLISKTDIVLYFTFYELHKTIANNWKGIPKKKSEKPGFLSMFRDCFECRDVNRFRIDMEIVRVERNKIAHSNKLYKLHETQRLYRIAYKWLEPLNVNVEERILAYRKMRPKFLNDVI